MTEGKRRLPDLVSTEESPLKKNSSDICFELLNPKYVSAGQFQLLRAIGLIILN